MSANNFQAIQLTYLGQTCSGQRRTLALMAFECALDGEVDGFMETANALSDLNVDVFAVLREAPGRIPMDVLVAAWGAQRYDFVHGVASPCLDLGRRPGAVFTGYLPMILEREREGSRAQQVAAELYERLLIHVVAQTGAPQMLSDRDGYAVGPQGQAILSRVCAEVLSQTERLAISAATPAAKSSTVSGKAGRL